MIIGVMYLLPDKTAFTPMFKVTINIEKCVTEFLNPEQIHVLGRRFTGTSMCACGGGGVIWHAYTLIFLLEFANNIHQAEIMGIDQPQTSKWLES